MGFFDELTDLVKEIKQPFVEAAGEIKNAKNEITKTAKDVTTEVTAARDEIKSALPSSGKKKQVQQNETNQA